MSRFAGNFNSVIWYGVPVFLCALFLVPFAALIVESASSGSGAFSHLVATVLPSYISNTIFLILGVGCLTLFFGAGTAWLVVRYDFTGSSILRWVLVLPLACPAYIAAFVYGDLFEYSGLIQGVLRSFFGWDKGDYVFPEIRSLPGAVFILSMVLYPYVFLLARVAFAKAYSLIAVAQTLGFNSRSAFFAVALPAVRPALVAGVAIVLMEAVADFGTMQLFAVDTYTTGIYRAWFSFFDRTAAAQLSAQLVIVVLLLFWMERYSRRRAQYQEVNSGVSTHKKEKLGGMANIFALLFCAIPVFFGFVVPVLQLVIWAYEVMAESVDIPFFRLAESSIAVASIAALLAVLIALGFSYILRFQGTPRSLRAILRVATIGYAVPGTVVAVGILIGFGWLDNKVDGLLRSIFDVSPGLIFSGTMVALIYAYVFRFLTLAQNAVESGMAKIPVELNWVARLHGLSRHQILSKVHIPIVQQSAVVAFLLVFIDVIKELPATLIIRPFNFETLATHTYLLAADERVAEAAPTALLIICTSMIPLFFLNRMIVNTEK